MCLLTIHLEQAVKDEILLGCFRFPSSCNVVILENMLYTCLCAPTELAIDFDLFKQKHASSPLQDVGGQ